MHHCNLAYAKITEKFGDENFIAGQVPGGRPLTVDDGVAILIPSGSVLALQIHFVSTGERRNARSPSACDTRVRPFRSGCTICSSPIVNTTIPPGAAAQGQCQPDTR